MENSSRPYLVLYVPLDFCSPTSQHSLSLVKWYCKILGSLFQGDKKTLACKKSFWLVNWSLSLADEKSILSPSHARRRYFFHGCLDLDAAVMFGTRWRNLNFLWYIIGNKPPGVVPSKLAYMGKDIKRLRDFYGIPIKAPSVSSNF